MWKEIEMSELSNVSSPKKVEKMIVLRIEINDRKQRNERLNEIKIWFFEKTNKIMSHWKDILRKKKAQIMLLKLKMET